MWRAVLALALILLSRPAWANSGIGFLMVAVPGAGVASSLHAGYLQ